MGGAIPCCFFAIKIRGSIGFFFGSRDEGLANRASQNWGNLSGEGPVIRTSIFCEP